MSIGSAFKYVFRSDNFPRILILSLFFAVFFTIYLLFGMPTAQVGSETWIGVITLFFASISITGYLSRVLETLRDGEYTIPGMKLDFLNGIVIGMGSLPYMLVALFVAFPLSMVVGSTGLTIVVVLVCMALMVSAYLVGIARYSREGEPKALFAILTNVRHILRHKGATFFLLFLYVAVWLMIGIASNLLTQAIVSFTAMSSRSDGVIMLQFVLLGFVLSFQLLMLGITQIHLLNQYADATGLEVSIKRKRDFVAL